jgi:CheY-like chemotaxis protein
MIEAMGGCIGFDSGYGKGSSFWFELPLADRKKEEHEELPEKASPISFDTPQAKAILYIEDNVINLMLVKNIIETNTDHDFLSATTAEEGVSIARKRQPGLILMDINLPGMNGFEALKVLQADERTMHIPVIAVSADAMPAQVTKGMAANFLDYLTKPIDINNLLRVVSERCR